MVRPFIRKSLRYKKRYVLVKFYCEKNIDVDSVIDAFLCVFHEFCGELLSALSRVKVVEKGSNFFVLKCRHNYVDLIRASCLFLERVGDSRILLVPVYVGGSIKKVRERIKFI